MLTMTYVKKRTKTEMTRLPSTRCRSATYIYFRSHDIWGPIYTKVEYKISSGCDLYVTRILSPLPRLTNIHRSNPTKKTVFASFGTKAKRMRNTCGCIKISLTMSLHILCLTRYNVFEIRDIYVQWNILIHACDSRDT